MRISAEELTPAEVDEIRALCSEGLRLMGRVDRLLTAGIGIMTTSPQWPHDPAMVAWVGRAAALLGEARGETEP